MKPRLDSWPADTGRAEAVCLKSLNLEVVCYTARDNTGGQSQAWARHGEGQVSDVPRVTAEESGTSPWGRSSGPALQRRRLLLSPRLLDLVARETEIPKPVSKLLCLPRCVRVSFTLAGNLKTRITVSPD